MKKENLIQLSIGKKYIDAHRHEFNSGIHHIFIYSYPETKKELEYEVQEQKSNGNTYYEPIEIKNLPNWILEQKNVKIINDALFNIINPNGRKN